MVFCVAVLQGSFGFRTAALIFERPPLILLHSLGMQGKEMEGKQSEKSSGCETNINLSNVFIVKT